MFGGGSLAVLAVVLLPALAAISARTEADRTLAPVVGRLGALGLFDDATTAQLERIARVVDRWMSSPVPLSSVRAIPPTTTT